MRRAVPGTALSWDLLACRRQHDAISRATIPMAKPSCFRDGKVDAGAA